MHRPLKSLRISEKQSLKATQVPDSLSEIEFRHGQPRGMIHASDDVFEFFVKHQPGWICSWNLKTTTLLTQCLLIL